MTTKRQTKMQGGIDDILGQNAWSKTCNHDSKMVVKVITSKYTGSTLKITTHYFIFSIFFLLVIKGIAEDIPWGWFKLVFIHTHATTEKGRYWGQSDLSTSYLNIVWNSILDKCNCKLSQVLSGLYLQEQYTVWPGLISLLLNCNFS